MYGITEYGRSHIDYDSASFQNWPSDLALPSGKLPITRFKNPLEENSIVYARGIIFWHQNNPETHAASWYPQISRECMRGRGANKAAELLEGGQCYRTIDY